MENRFKFFKLSLSARLIAAAALFAAAVAAQILSASTLAGMPPVVAAWFLLALKSASNKPHDTGLEEWRAVTDGEVARIADNLARSKKLRAGISGANVLSGILFTIAIVPSFMASLWSSRVGLVIFDLCLFCLPGLFFGRVSAHIPFEFDQKLPRFIAVMNVPRPEAYLLTPYLRFDKDDKGRDVPEDLRLLLEPRRKPADLVGVQFQASINKGANGNVPYMYAVVLTRGTTGPTYTLLRAMKARGFELEAGGDPDYGTIVVRQGTGDGGYHTTNDDCVKLMTLMLKALEKTEIA